MVSKKFELPETPESMENLNVFANQSKYDSLMRPVTTANQIESVAER